MQVGMYSATTDGEATIASLAFPPDTYNVTVTAANYAAYTTILTISSSTTNVIQDFSLTPISGCSATITGQVTCSCDANPIAGALVTIGDYSTNTDSTGNYSISNVAPGTYNVTVSASNYATNSTTVAIPSSTPNITQNFSLESITCSRLFRCWGELAKRYESFWFEWRSW